MIGFNPAKKQIKTVLQQIRWHRYSKRRISWANVPDGHPFRKYFILFL